MAAIWEGESEGVGLSVLTAPTEWESEEAFGDVSGMSVVLSCAKDVIQLVATPKPATHKFEALFDNRRLDDAGFGPRIDFGKRVQLLGVALKGDESLSATLKAESGGMKLVIQMQMAGFKVDYTLPLKRVDFDETDILRQQLAQSTALVAEMQQKMDAAVAKGDATQKQLVAATTKTEALEQRMAASKTELVETKEELAVSKTEIERIRAALAKSTAESSELMTRIHFRDASIRELKKSSTQFRFGTSIFGGETNPSRFEVSADGKSANAKNGAQMVLTPALSSDCQLKLVVEKNAGGLYVGITDDYSKYVTHGCAFISNGNVYVNSSLVAKSQPFGDWRTGDRLLLKAHLSSGTVTIESRPGKYTAKWKPKKEPIYFAVYCFEGTALRIE